VTIRIFVYWDVMLCSLMNGGRHLLKQWFPTFFHLHTPRQPISINCTLHISKILVINIVAVILNLYFVSVNK
jgi:hypothetical protein